MADPSECGAPEHLTAERDISGCNARVPEFDAWLKKRAFVNETTGTSRTYVVRAHGQVVGYYALATGSVARRQAPGRVCPNMPDPVPVMIRGRLAVDRTWRGRDPGRDLQRDAVLRTLQAATIGGTRTILVHAISQEAARFYQDYRCVVSAVDPLILMIT